MTLLDQLWRDLRFAARVLRRSYGFTIVVVATMALGIGASAALFGMIKGALLERWPYEGYDRLVTFRANSPRLARVDFPLWSAAEYRDLARRTDLFDFVIAGEGRGVTVGGDGQAERVPAGLMTANAWPMLGIPPLLGRTFDAADDRPGGSHVAVVSHRFWRNHLGGRADVVGAVLRVDQTPFTIVGVMPPEFVWWDRDLWLPLQLDSRDADRGNRRWYVQARLRPGVTRDAAQAALPATTGDWQREFALPEYENLRIGLQPLVAVTLRDVRQMLYVLLAAVCLVLVVAAANVATLLLVRGAMRRGEIAVRLALGASAPRVAAQLITESVLVALVAAGAGLWLATVLLQPLVALIPVGIPAEAHIRIDWRVAIFAVATALAFVAASATVPALRSVRINVADDIRDAGRRGGAAVPRILDLFMTVQFVVALVVLSATVAVVGSFERTLASNPGFDDRDVLTFRLAFGTAPDRNGDLSARLVTAAAALPGVRAAAASTSVPIGEDRRASFAPGSGDLRIDANIDSTTPRFFATLGAGLADGRDFADTDDAAHPRVAIVNATAAARLWPHESAIGQRLIWREHPGGDVPLTVVGVAADLRRDGIATPAAPAVFVPVRQEPAAALSVLLRAPGDQQGLFGAARQALAAIAPDVPVYAPQTLASLRRDALGSERLAAVLLVALALAALALSTIGIYGVTRYIVEQRTGEFGIRLALGAAPSDLVTLVVSRTARNAAVGIAVGVGCSWIVLRMLTAAIVGLDGAGVWLFAAAALPLVAAAGVAAYLPARRAAATSPVEALRSE